MDISCQNRYEPESTKESKNKSKVKKSKDIVRAHNYFPDCTL